MATSLKDVKMSTEGEPPVQSPAEPLYIPDIPETEKENPATESWIIFKLVKHKKGGCNVDGCDDVMVVGADGKARTQRIWLLNGATSIWQRDLLDLIKDKDFMRTNRRSLRFINGVLRLPSWDTLAIEFARTTRHNVKMRGKRDVSKQAFYEYDPAAQQKAELNKRMTRIKAITEASNMPVADMREHASFLGIPFIDELGRPKSDDGIRSEYIVRADIDPVNWNRTKGTPEVKIMFLIKAAIIDSKVELGQGVVRWANGGFICNQPVGKQAEDCMLELAMSATPQGKAFIQQLQKVST